MGAPVVQWQMVRRDAEGAAKFYASLFDWTIDANNAMGYREANTDSDRGINGGFWPRGDEGYDLVQLFIEVDDIDPVIQRAVSLGGKILVPQQELPDGDAIAFVLDPGGLSFGLYTPASRRSASSNKR